MREQFTFSGIAEFVSRHYAAFSAGSKIGADLEVQITFSGIAEFVKWAQKKPPKRGKLIQTLSCRGLGVS